MSLGLCTIICNFALQNVPVQDPAVRGGTKSSKQRQYSAKQGVNSMCWSSIFWCNASPCSSIHSYMDGKIAIDYSRQHQCYLHFIFDTFYYLVSVIAFEVLCILHKGRDYTIFPETCSFFCTCHNFFPLSSVQIFIIPACCLLCVL